MEKKFLQMLQIEENLKKSFDLNYFVLFNTTSACIIEKYNELLFYHMLDEECDLHLKDVSLFQINQYLKLLENEFVANKTSFLFEDISVYSFHLVPKVRLYSQLKKEKMRKLKKRLL